MNKIASLHKVLQSCRNAGFDIAVPFCVEEYNSHVKKAVQLQTFSQEQTLGILIVIGNSRAIWPIFIEYLSSIDYHMNDDPNPLDEYTRKCIKDAFQSIPFQTDICFAFEQRHHQFLPFQRLSEMCGLAEKDSPVPFGYSRYYGTWYGLRAAISIDMEYELGNEIEQATPCHLLDQKCIQYMKEEYDKLFQESDYALDYEQDNVWRRWLYVRTLVEEHANPYSWYETAYHYSKNQQYLQGEINRFRNGKFTTDYNWIEDFQKDVLNYKLHEY